MTTLREAATRALEALENSRPVANEDDFVGLVRLHDAAIKALRTALAEPVQDPVVQCDCGDEFPRSEFDGQGKCPNCSSGGEPVQQPVAWRTFDGEGGYDYRTYEDNENYRDEWDRRNPNHKGWVEPLYTHPAPDDTALLRQALEALEFESAGYCGGEQTEKALIALRERLEVKT
jgi:predicted Zn-ribbon and HTH transcriptional regulator